VSLVTITHNLPAVEGDLKKLAQKIKNLRPAFKSIGEHLLLSTENRFVTSTDPDGNKWAPLKVRTYHQAYMAGNDGRKNKRKTHTKQGKMTAAFQRYLERKKILIGSGQLKDSIAPRATNTGLIVGTPKKYAAVHQLGGPAGRKNKQFKMPARPFLGISKQDEVDILNEIKLHLAL